MANRGRRDRVRGALSAARYDTRGCSAVEDALDRIADFQPDIILLDARADDRFGSAPPSMMSWMRSPAARLIGRLRDEERKIPVILLAAGAIEDELLARGLEAGAVDFLSLSRSVELVSRVRVHVREKKDQEAFEEVRQERDRLRHSAQIDGVTGLPNRAVVTEQLERATTGGDPFAVLFIDVDDFRSLRDRFGHDAGEQILRAVADAAKGCARVGDHLGRYGDEEFVLIAHGAERSVAEALAERVHAQMEAIDLAVLSGRPVTATIGVSIFNPASGRGAAAIESLPDIAAPRSQRKMMAASASLRVAPPVEETPTALPAWSIYDPRESAVVAVAPPSAPPHLSRTVPVPQGIAQPRIDPSPVAPIVFAPPVVAVPPLPLPRILAPPRRVALRPAHVEPTSAPPVTRSIVTDGHADLDGERRHARVARTVTFVITLIMGGLFAATILSWIYNTG